MLSVCSPGDQAQGFMHAEKAFCQLNSSTQCSSAFLFLIPILFFYPQSLIHSPEACPSPKAEVCRAVYLRSKTASFTNEEHHQKCRHTHTLFIAWFNQFEYTSRKAACIDSSTKKIYSEIGKSASFYRQILII